MYLKDRREFVRLGGAFSLLLVCLGVVLLVAHAQSQSSACLLIETSAVTELLDPQTLSVRDFNYPPITARDGSPAYDYKYSPDGKSLAMMQGQGVAITDLTVETLAKPFPVSTFADTFLIRDVIPPTTMAWSPDSRWIAVEIYTTTQYLTIMDAASRSQHTIEFDPPLTDHFEMEWSADSQFLLTQSDNSADSPSSVSLYQIPDLNRIDLGPIGSTQIGTCLGNCWAANATQHRAAYAAPVPGQPHAANLVLLDAAAPTLKVIPIPQTGNQIAVGIDPSGSYVAVANESDVPIGGNETDPTSVPLWIYSFDSGQGVHIADVADTVYSTRGLMGEDGLLFPEIAWSANGDTLYYIAFTANNLSMQLWAYQPVGQRKWQIASWSTADSPYGYSFYVSPNNQRIVLGASPYWQSRVQLVIPEATDSRVVNLMADGHSSSWSPDSRSIAVGHLDETVGTLSITLFDQNGIALANTSINDMADEFFDFNWTGCQLP